jgi:hypothetical protein
MSDASMELAEEERHPEAVAAARAVLQAHFAALNARDEAALAATLHFPHYRLSGGRLRTWPEPERYFADFLARATADWHHSTLDHCEPLAASADKVHLDVCFSRCREDGSRIESFRSLWVVSCLEGRWAAQLRSSFAR